MTDYSQAIRAVGVASTRDSSRVTVVSLLPALFLPSVAGAIFAVALLQVLFLSQGPQSLFADSDTGWHIRNGEAILASQTLPFTDPFSYTREGHEWFAWEWMSDVLLGAAHRVAGPSGVAMLAAMTIALTAWAMARFALSLGANIFLTAAGTVLLLGTTSIHWLARPHLFSWPLALVFIWIAERERRSSTRLLFVAPFIVLLWANLHGSFLLGPAILFIYALGEGLRPSAAKARIRFAGTCLVSLLATLINPYGWRLHQHVISYLNNSYLMDHISEFRSFNFHAPGSLYIELFLLAAVIGTLALIRQKAFGPALLSLAMIHLALFSARHLPTAAVMLLPLSIAAVTHELKSWPRLGEMVRYSERLRVIDRRVWSVVPVILVVALAFAGVSTFARDGAIGFSAAKFPVRAADFLETQKISERIFTTDQWGGYLIYRFDGHTKVFADGRSDFYGQTFLESYARVANAKPGWDAVLNQYEVRFVLVPSDHSLVSVLSLERSWKRAYSDSVAILFERVNAE